MSATTVSERQESIEKLRDLMKSIQFCMLTTHDQEGDLRSRPMALQESEFDGDLWFFTGKSTEKVHEIDYDRHVNVSFSNPDDNRYVSVSGTARLVDDRAKAKELWNPIYKVWFPKGLDDPDLTLLRVTVAKAEYWDSPHGVVTYLAGFLKVMTTGEKPKEIGDHEKLTLKRR